MHHHTRLVLLVLIALAAAPQPASAFAPNDPLASQQWYLAQDHAFDAWPQPPTNLQPIKVAVIDSGIDGGHPEFVGKIAAAKSFLRGSPLTDERGHGTFVAGEIAAATNNGQGIAGIALNAQLLVAKVVRGDGTVLPDTEAQAIRWAVDNGARVINLSLGGVRDPSDPRIDTYSEAEASAVRYAIAHRVTVVAAVGNGDETPSTPWPYASYPAALPHVIGVSALAQDGSVPDFSNRDPVFNELAAPGVGIISTFPRALTAALPACADQGYSDCGPPEYRSGTGTSFAAPQVAAAAALLLGIDPQLAPDQVTWLLERSAGPVNPDTGCLRCPFGRSALAGWGRLDIAAAVEALSSPFPPADPYEPNNDAGSQAYPLWGAERELTATVDFWENPVDVYRVHLRSGQTLVATLQASTAGAALLLWKPGTRHIDGPRALLARELLATSAAPAVDKRLQYHAQASGWYYLEVKMIAQDEATYRLNVAKGAF